MGFRLQIRIGHAEVLLEGEASLSVDAIKDLSTHLNGLASNPLMWLAPTHAPLKRVDLGPTIRSMAQDGNQRRVGQAIPHHLKTLLRDVFEQFPVGAPAPPLLENGPSFLQKRNGPAMAGQARH